MNGFLKTLKFFNTQYKTRINIVCNLGSINGLLIKRFISNRNVLLSDIGEGIAQVEIVEWYVGVDDVVKEFDRICEVKSDKASVTITSRYNGKIKNLKHAISDIVDVGDTLFEIEIDGDELDHNNIPKIDIENNGVILNSEIKPQKDSFYKMSPAMRNIIKKNNIVPESITRFGEGNRILKKDVIDYLSKETSVKSHNNLSSSIITLDGYNKTMFKTMTESLKIPHFVFHDEININNFYINFKNYNKKNDKRLTHLPFFVKALSKTLEKFPILSSKIINHDPPTIQVNNNFNIGIAMNTPYGLVVPVLKNVQNKSILEISEEIAILKILAMSDKLKLENITGGSITISSIGGIGGRSFFPRILPPQVAIVAIGKIYKTLDAKNKKQYMLPVSWAADHRVIDGATIGQSSSLWFSFFTNPYSLFL